jgi:predicted TIM-barrel fold metal-dependent hydrolase
VEVARHFNDHALEMVSESGGRLITLAQVPLNDTDAACAEASRAMKTGHHGIQIGNHVGPLDLDADRLVAFLHHCADDNVRGLVRIMCPSSLLTTFLASFMMCVRSRCWFTPGICLAETGSRTT